MLKIPILFIVEIYAGIIFLCQAILPAFSNIISNGDFESEAGLDPWYCNQAQCDNSQDFLVVTQRKAVWSGPRQLLDPDVFNTVEDLKATFNFSMLSSESITAEWKIKVTKGQETQYFSLFGTIGKIFFHFMSRLVIRISTTITSLDKEKWFSSANIK